MKQRVFTRFILTSCAICLFQNSDAKEKDNSLLFSVNYDDYSVTAGFAKGDPKCYSFENPDLQLRMFPGIKNKGNALSLTNEESCTYKVPGNLDPRQGTVSMWVSPQNWRVTSNRWQRFFNVRSPKINIILYKFIWPKYTLFYLEYPGAPGNKKVFSASTMLEGNDWKPGKWHKLDITWDSKGMKLYVDGVMPAVYHKDGQIRIPFVKFQNPLALPAPEDLKDSYFTIGMPESARENKGTDLSYRTAYDDIKIYNRPLSTAEIRAAYEKYFPSKLASELQRPVITIPKTNSMVKVDGEVNTSEWSNAGLVPVSGFLGNPLPGISAKAYYQYDKKFLYIGMRANRACRMLKNHADNDGNLWEEDSFEIILQSPKSNIYHFIINGNGALYDELDTNKKWNSSARCAAVQGKDYWSAEIAIPLEAFAEQLVGQDWNGNFGATYYTNTGRYSGWSKILYSYADPKSFGAIRFGNDDTAVRLEKIGNLAIGALDLVANVVPKEKAPQLLVSAQSLLDGAEAIRFPGQVAGKAWKTTLPPGKQTLQIKGMKNKKELAFLYEKFTYVNFPLEISYTCWSKRKYIEVNIDLNNSGLDNVKRITTDGLSGVIQLVGSDGKAYSSQQFKAMKSNCDVKLSLPDNLASGTYVIRAEVNGLNAKLTREVAFSVPDMTPYKEKVAVDHSIPFPWQAVTTTDNKTFKLLDREYTFDHKPFPVQVVSRGEKLLTSPVILRCNGKPVNWTDFEVVEKNADVIKFNGKGIAATTSFDWMGELWFDGLYHLEFKMNPKSKSGTQIDSLNLSWDMPAEFAKFVMSPLCNKWENDQILLMPKPSAITAREHMVWLTGHMRGFLWWPHSNANWVNQEAEKPITVSRKNGTVNASLNIISKPANLAKTAVYKMAFMATPAKDQPKGFRKFHADSFGRAKGQTAQHIGWGSHRNEFHKDDTIGYVGHIPRDPAAYKKVVQGWRKKEIAPFTYAMPGQISSKTAEYDYFRKTWATTPSHAHRFAKGGTKYQLQRCCGNTEVADLFAWRTEQLFKQYPELQRNEIVC